MIQNIPDEVELFLTKEALGEIISTEPVSGGHINQTCRIVTTSQRSFILKQNTEIIDRLFECEAAGLKTLREAGMRTPDVLAVGEKFILLEDLGSHAANDPDWEKFGRAVAHQHLHRNDRFGFAYNNYLGPLPQINTWMDNGHEFFGQHRVLRYLSEPRCEQVLNTQDRQNLEYLVKRLPDLVPKQQPSLLHGDLWHTNMLFDPQGIPALIDPAVYYGWPEAELSMTREYGKVPSIFYDAYIEVNPLDEGWWDRLELLYIRQLMAVIAFFGNEFNTLEELRTIIAKFS